MRFGLEHFKKISEECNLYHHKFLNRFCIPSQLCQRKS